VCACFLSSLYLYDVSHFPSPSLNIEINAALLLETMRPADHPQSASLMQIRKIVSYGLFYAAFAGGAVICLAYWYNNTRRKDDGNINIMLSFINIVFMYS
jgi:hypothetical protein